MALTDEAALLLLAALLYLSECAHWLPRGGVAFIGGGGRGRLLRPSHTVGNSGGGLIWGGALSTPGSLYLLSPPPMIATRQGVWVAAEPGRLRSYPRSEDVTRRGAAVMFEGEVICRCQRAEVAQRWVDRLSTLAAAEPDRRGALLDAEADAARDLVAIEQAAEAVARGRLFSSMMAFALGATIFISLPINVWRFGLAECLALIGWPLLGLHALHLLIYGWSHRRMYPKARGARWLEILKACLSPPMAVRAPDTLSKHRLAGFEPVAVAAILAKPEIFAAFAGETARALQHPLQTERDAGPAAEALAEHRERRLRGILALCAAREIDPFKAPRLPSGALAWCPRCQVGYQRVEGSCGDCPGVGLIPAAPEQTRRPRPSGRRRSAEAQ